jgi:polyisoprenoid-binding protein YceI
MKRVLVAGILAFLVAVAPGMALAAPWTIDTSHTSVNFKIRHLFTKVNGSFQKVEGTFTFDPQHPEAGSVEAVIDAASITTRNEKRDNHLRSPDFFDVAKFPQITFKSTKVEKDDAGMRLIGDLTMHGVTKPVTLNLEFLGAGPHMLPGSQVSGFSATGTLNRKDFGLEWNKALETGGTLLGDEVEIEIGVEAVQMPEEGKAGE